MTRTIPFVLLTMLTCLPLAADEKAPALAPRYVDLLHGFSLRPPAGAERERSPSVSRLVSWRRRDPETGAVAWTLSMHHAPMPSGPLDLKAYARLLATRLSQGEQFAIAHSGVTKAAGRDAIDLRGTTTGRTRFWQRQLWVPGEEGRFLIVKLTGPAGEGEALGALSEQVLATLKIVDAETALKRREEMLARGKAVLAGLTMGKLAEALADDPQWAIFGQEGKPVGFMRIVESASDAGGDKGVEVRGWVYLAPTRSAQQTLARHVLFATPDRTVERWTKDVRARAGGAGPFTQTSSTTVVMEGWSVACSQTGAGQGGQSSRTRTRPVPPGNQPVYLPQAINALLWRLVDLETPQAYAFAIYNPAANGFDMRTLIVHDQEMLEVEGKKVEAVRLTERMAADQDPYETWVTPDGELLRTGGGPITLRAATRSDVATHFPRADELLRALQN